jgi:hypothetical protein
MAHRSLQPLDASAQPEPVRLDALDQGRELTAGEARAAFESLFVGLLLRIDNQRIFDAAKVKR